MQKPVIFLSTCEFSGDIYGEILINEIRKRVPEVSFYGVGGAKMAGAGMELLFDTTSRSTLGFTEALKNLRVMKRLISDIVSEWEKRRPDLVLWLDSGGFNLPLALEAKKRGIPVVCMFSPSAWAYGQDRAVKLAARVKLLMAVLPFEADFYRRFGTNVIYVGHPLIDRVKSECEPHQYRRGLGVNPDQKLVALMPGSRKQEINRLLPPMLDAARIIEQEMSVKWVLPVAGSINRDWLESLLQKYPVRPRIITRGAYDLLAAADGAIISSGTATLEAAILNTPMVVIYRISKLSYFIYKRMESPEHKGKPVVVGLPNLILGRKVIPEVLQEDLTPANIANELRSILIDSRRTETMRRELLEVKNLIGPEGVMERAADLIVSLL